MTFKNSEEQTARLVLFRWLATLFQREADVATIAWYRSDDGSGFFSFLTEYPAFSDGAGKIQKAVCTSEPIDGAIIRLAGSFASLFHGVDPVHAAPPYESHFRSAKGQLYGPESLAMETLLSRHGMRLDGFSEPADHIAVSLHLMAHLIEQGNAPAQEEVIRDHLGGWVDEFAEDCIRFDKSGFYAGAATILKAILAEERREGAA